MSESRIRRIFTEHLKSKLKQPNGTLKWKLEQTGIDIPPITDNHITVTLLPAPTHDATLSGDVIVYTGIYQMSISITSTLNGNVVVDRLAPAEEMTDFIRDCFKVNTEYKDASGFTVKVVSPLKVTAFQREQKDQWFVVHTYFDYWAESN